MANLFLRLLVVSVLLLCGCAEEEAADDELAMRQPGFTSPLIKMGARTVEKLERVGVEAGALALPPLRDPVQCFRDAERRHARREICRRRMLLERVGTTAAFPTALPQLNATHTHCR